MYKMAITFFVVVFSLNASAQSLLNRDTTCDFLKKIHLKSKNDTIVVKAVFRDINPLAGYGYLAELDIEGKLKKEDFTYQIVFQPENCSIQYFCPSKAKNKMINGSNLGTIIYLTCVVFKEYKYDYSGTPYFVVIKASFDKS